MAEPCHAPHPIQPGVQCVFVRGHEVNYHFDGSDDSNGNVGYRWPVQGSQAPATPEERAFKASVPTGGPDIEDVAEATQTGFVLNAIRAHEYMTSLSPEKAAKLLGEDRGESIDRQVAAEWKRLAMHALAQVGELSTLLCDRDCQLAQDFEKLQRVRALMADPDPYRQDLGPDGTFNVPCVLVSDLKKALDG